MTRANRGETALPTAPDRYSVQDQIQLRLAVVRAIQQLASRDDFTGSIEVESLENDFNVGDADVLRMEHDSAFAADVTGLAGGWPGRHLYLINVGSVDINLWNEAAASEAGNRVITGTGADIPIAADEVVHAWYDGVTGRWRVMNHY